jgi:hypothetical protein
MKKKRRRATASEMRPEYEFDYRQARPNRFAGRMSADAVAVVLDPDAAAVFRSPKSVNDLLRSVIAALPGERRGRSPRRERAV